MDLNAHKSILEWLSKDPKALNGVGTSHYEILNQPPSALEFSRLVRISRPVIIKGFRIPATELWTFPYLLQKLEKYDRPPFDTNVSVAITPDGRADAVTKDMYGNEYFVEPLVEKIPFVQFLSSLQTSVAGRTPLKEIAYLQSQNGNLYRSDRPSYDDAGPCELKALRDDVPKDIPWASEALGTLPDAVNVWIGDGCSVTSTHSDPYENIYHVVRGRKHFTLFPPTDGVHMKERVYHHARYTRDPNSKKLVITPTPNNVRVPWTSIADPTKPGAMPGTSAISITLDAGDTLYLPAGWWHYVWQTGFTIAVNWWYDIEPQGMGLVWLQFLRERHTELEDEDMS